MHSDHLMTVRRFLLEEQRRYPDARGRFTNLLLDIVLGCARVGFEVRRFGLSAFQELTGAVNVQNEAVHQLDVLADGILVSLLLGNGEVCAVATEEHEEIIPVTDPSLVGDYAVVLDPLDGFSNIGVGINVGTIFSVHRRRSPELPVSVDDFLQPGTRQVCAGYVMYGPSMVLVLSVGQGVHEFTYDPVTGAFLLSRRDITIPDRIGTGSFSVNEAYVELWDDRTRETFAVLKRSGYSGRYVGSLVADFHRTLLTGGIFAYPAHEKSPGGKLRLLCELAPLAFILSQAKGAATNGHQPILDLVPTALHQRSPVYMGSPSAVELVHDILT